MKTQLNRDAIPKSYREYLDRMKQAGEMVEINDEVDWYLEMGAIYRLSNETHAPGAIFNNIKDCPKGFRAADFGMSKSNTPGRPWARLAIMLGLPPESGLMEIQAAYLEAIETGERHDPILLESSQAPCKQNIWMGDDIDLTKFPAPIGHDGDGGRYIQTAGLNIVQTPNGEWTNWSTNRAMIVNKNTMTGLWIPSQHNGMIHQMWTKEGKDTPFAIALGVSAAAVTQAGARCPDWVDEYDYVSRLLDAPLEMVKCETNDLLVPADAEIVIEGYVSKDEWEVEGPFGEFPGYMSEQTDRAPRQIITAITFRNDPILPICLPGVPLDSGHVSMSFFGSTDAVIAMRKSGFPVIDSISMFESANHWQVFRVKDDWHKITGLTINDFVNQFADTYWGQHVGGRTKLLLVGEDIDPSDVDKVVWAFATRNHPTEGTYHFPQIARMGTGLEYYHTTEELLKHRGGLVIYSCLELPERVGLSKKGVLSFEENFPIPVKNKVLNNWSKWGFDKPKSK
ncbi:UbiD family decarboxylase [Vibrio superstes]|uniref:3-octaprenyl-4-hydroxybenzoate carboxy-lyase n=1 Tax=Vibrio superstes NBRC 103154 TaxID=1219062 RepID=A0A511QP00_9VIBR|nr:UbiD family decarboxylase [Vibrio superstes]GEM78867.1 UbiD-like decarboxylase [Vibrio superstes NBRC 103154]